MSKFQKQKNFLTKISKYYRANRFSSLDLALKKSEKGRIAVFTKDPILPFQQLLKLPRSIILTSEYVNYRQFFPSKLHFQRRKIKIPKFSLSSKEDDSNSTNLHNITLNTVLSFLYTIYNSHDWFFKEDLLSLPISPQSPVFTLTPYELRTISQDDSIYISKERKQILEGYSYFKEILKNSSKQSDLEKLFGRSEIPLDDFVYAISIEKSNFFTFKKGRKFDKYFMPFAHFMREREIIHENLSNFAYIQPKANHFNILSTSAFEKGQEVHLYYGISSLFSILMNLGQVPNEFQQSDFCFKIPTKLPENLASKIFLLKK